MKVAALYDALLGTVGLWVLGMAVITHCALKIATPGLAARDQSRDQAA